MISLYVANLTEQYDITNLVESVTWSGDYKQACRKLEFSLVSSSFDKNIPKVPIKNGNMILFYENGKELFRGFVYNYGKNSSNNNIDYTAFDFGVKFNDLKISYNVKNKSANEMFEKVLSDYKLAKGDIVKVNTKVTKIFMTSAYDMIMTMYTQASKVDGNKYMIIAKEGKFSSIKKGTVKLQVAFEEGKNLIDSSFSESIEKMVNRVIIVDEFGNYKSEVKNEADIKLYGLFQDILKIEEGKNSITEAKSMLQSVDRTCSLEGYGDSTCITGYGVTVKDSYTGLVGLFYIDSDTHKWEKGDYTISLGLNFKNIMNEVEAGEDEQKQSSSSTTVTGGREVEAEFTAYAPTGNRTANGEKTNPSSLTCAVPKSVAFNTKIQIKGTGTSRDNLVYRANDTGGAIVIDSKGVYHIDLLMATDKECRAFGRRRGKAIIGVEVSNGNDGTSSDKARKAVEFANSKVGSPHRYIWGATGPTHFDCSGLTQWCYKQVGISIPRTSQAQSTFGKSVSKDNLQTGDLIFFSTNGTGRVSHVGIYEGNGVFIHASSPSSGIKKSKLSDSYYVKAWKGARRVV